MEDKTLYYNWLFHYNSYDELWHAFHREDYAAYWNGTETRHPTYASESFTTVVNAIEKCT